MEVCINCKIETVWYFCWDTDGA